MNVKEYVYYPIGVCSSKFVFLLEDRIIKKLTVTNGCAGNSLGIAKLLEGKTTDEVIEVFTDLKCGRKNTSCPGQIALALKEYNNSL